MSKMTERLARHTVEHYRCSRCWNDLTMTLVVDSNGQLEKTEEGEQLAEVKCRSADKDFGFITKYFIDRERAKDFDNAFEVKRDLIKLGIITKEKAHG